MKNESIVDRVVERLKLQPLGDLITEEDLHDIVKQAIPKVFFQEQKFGDGYNSKIKPPVIVEIMSELLQESAKSACEKWLIENADVVTDYWTKVLDQNLLTYVQKIQAEQATTQVKNMLFQYVQKINEDRRRIGLSEIYL